MSAFGGGRLIDEPGRVACAAAATVTYANGMPTALVKSSEMRVVITTWMQEEPDAPAHARGTGLPGSATGGEFTWTLSMKPLVAPHGTLGESNQVVLNDVAVDLSH